MITIHLTQEAKQDLNSIIEHISKDSPERARSYTLKMINKAYDLLEVFPLSCPIHNEEKQIRLFVFEKYNLYYQYDEKDGAVYIIHILNSAKLSDSLF